MKVILRWEKEELAAKVGVDPRTMDNVVGARPGYSMSLAVYDSLYRVLNEGLKTIDRPHIRQEELLRDFAGPYTLGLDLERFCLESRPGTPTPNTAGGTGDREKWNDLKNVITDENISKRLLAGEPPSLLECITATTTRYLSEREKALPQAVDFPKHFFGPSILFYVESPAIGEPVLLKYHRTVNPGEAGNVARTGWSILFHTSFKFRVPKDKGAMDSWVRLATQNPQVAEQEFVRMPKGTLVDLMSMYKLKMARVEGSCKPFGVLTRDLRRGPERRAYTQFVFLLTVRLPKATTTEKLKNLLRGFETDNVPLISAVEDIEPDYFLKSGPDPKIMDYLALRGLREKKKLIDYPGDDYPEARFTRGFAII
jgi:hypothetical protein